MIVYCVRSPIANPAAWTTELTREVLGGQGAPRNEYKDPLEPRLCKLPTIEPEAIRERPVLWTQRKAMCIGFVRFEKADIV